MNVMIKLLVLTYDYVLCIMREDIFTIERKFCYGKS